MRVVLRIFSLDVLDLTLSTDPDVEPYDTARDLSGGTVASMPINVAYRPSEEDMGERPVWDD